MILAAFIRSLTTKQTPARNITMPLAPDGRLSKEQAVILQIQCVLAEPPGTRPRHHLGSGSAASLLPHSLFQQNNEITRPLTEQFLAVACGSLRTMVHAQSLFSCQSCRMCPAYALPFQPAQLDTEIDSAEAALGCMNRSGRIGGWGHG